MDQSPVPSRKRDRDEDNELVTDPPSPIDDDDDRSTKRSKTDAKPSPTQGTEGDSALYGDLPSDKIDVNPLSKFAITLPSKESLANPDSADARVGRPTGADLFLGNSKFVSEDELRSLFAHYEATDFRFPKDHEGNRKDFCFVSFKTRKVAEAVLATVGDSLTFGSTQVRANLSEEKKRLHVGKLPKTMTSVQFDFFVSQHIEGVVKVDFPRANHDNTNPAHVNRGYAFIEFDSQASAETAKRFLASPELTIDGNNLTIGWSEDNNKQRNRNQGGFQQGRGGHHQHGGYNQGGHYGGGGFGQQGGYGNQGGRPQQPINETSEMRNVFISDLPPSAHDKQWLDQNFSTYGEIEKITVPQAKPGKSPFAFVVFKDTNAAQSAIHALNGMDVDGRQIRVQMAKQPKPRGPRFDNHQGGGGYQGQQGGMPVMYGGAPGYGSNANAVVMGTQPGVMPQYPVMQAPGPARFAAPAAAAPAQAGYGVAPMAAGGQGDGTLLVPVMMANGSYYYVPATQAAAMGAPGQGAPQQQGGGNHGNHGKAGHHNNGRRY